MEQAVVLLAVQPLQRAAIDSLVTDVALWIADPGGVAALVWIAATVGALLLLLQVVLQLQGLLGRGEVVELLGRLAEVAGYSEVALEVFVVGEP